MNLPGRSRTDLIIAGIVAVVAALLPLVMSNYMVNIGVQVLLFAYLATAWNILGGYAGQHSLGNALFLGIGAYTSTILFINLGVSPWIGMWVGALLAGLAGWFVGFVSFRYGLKGPYFALVTIALAEMAVYVVSNMPALGGATGLEVRWLGNFPLLLQFEDKRGYYYVILAMTIIAVLITYWFSGRRFGFRLMAVRENEDAAEALGVNTLRSKVNATVLSAVLTAIGGTFFAQYYTYINPRNVFGEGPSVQMLLFAIIGGLGTVWGPSLGALLLVPISEWTRAQLGGTVAGANLFLYGLILVLVILFMPRGIMGLIDSIRQRSQRKPAKTAMEGGGP